MRVDDLVLFAKLAEVGSFSAAARELGVPKQTLSRRIAELEAELCVPLLQRTTRKLRLTELGSAYALRCQEIARLAREANEVLSSSANEVAGLLRITADPTFGEAYVWPWAEAFLERHPKVSVDVLLTNRYVDLVEEGVDVAFRVGRLTEASLVGRKLGPATLRYCASPNYLEHNAPPARPDDLSAHALIDFAIGQEQSRWPFAGPDGTFAVPITGRVRVNSLALARRAALCGFGVANLPVFAVERDLADGRLMQVLAEWTVDVGAVHVVYPRHRFLLPRVRRFVDLVFERTTLAFRDVQAP